MKKLICILFFLPLLSFAQDVEIIHFDQLEARIAKEQTKLLVVNFWATWCGPCVKELVHFEKIHENYKDKDVHVLLVSLDFPNKIENSLKPFIKKNSIDADLVVLDEPNSNKWIDKIDPSWSGAIPCTLVINPVKHTRNFYEKEFTYEELEKTINQLK